MKPILSFVILLFLIIGCAGKPVTNSNGVIYSDAVRANTQTAQASGTKYAIATQGDYATKAAQEILDKGGNLIDAAVAASFTISVERPHSTGIGGGGFLMYYEAKTKKTYAIDFRERAPIKATKNMYLDEKGEVITGKSLNGHTAVAVPGLVAGLMEIHERFGKLPLKTVMAPAISLAENGFKVYPSLSRALKNRTDVLKQDSASMKIFAKDNLTILQENDLLVQKDLARTLRTIAERGRSGFYKGKVAQSIVESQKKGGGLIQQKDLDNYKVIWRKPVQAKYLNYDVVSMPPPSSGGVHVIQFLKMVEKLDLAKRGPYCPYNIHMEAASFQSAFADRAKYLGDPDFVKVPTEGLIAENYVQKRFNEIPKDRARKASEVTAGEVPKEESTETTHFSLMDSEGNAVASTQTINGHMGAAVVAPGTGIVLNNEMDDFSAKPGAANLFGAIGGDANAIEANKTPLSSMSPTILLEDGKPVMSVGAPGGTRIITCTAQTILNATKYGQNLYDAVAGVRYHHQWQPDILFLDTPGPGARTVKKLKAMGYEVKMETVPCNVMAVSRQGDKFTAVADPRDIGTAAAR